VSFGFGLPLTLPRQQVSFINFAFEFGQNGGNTTIQETYGRLTVGFTLVYLFIRFICLANQLNIINKLTIGLVTSNE